MSYAPEVQADQSGRWYGNGVRFATHAEAIEWAKDRAMRWTQVKDYRAVESDDPVNYRWDADAHNAVAIAQ
jgi:hypothetical protein